MCGELEFEAALRERVAMIKGVAVADLERCFEERVRLNPGARTMVRTMVRAPGFSRTRSSKQRSRSATATPLIIATRSRRAASNSSSPHMARSVMATTWSLTPAKSAISSRHSQPMMVESMSATSSRFLRPSQG